MSWFLENNIQYISMRQLNSDNILYTLCACAQMKRNVNVLSVMSLPICYCHHREFAAVAGGVFGCLTDVSSGHIWYLPSPPPPAEREIDRGRPRIACLVPLCPKSIACESTSSIECCIFPALHPFVSDHGRILWA